MIRIEASNQAGTQVWNLDVQHTPVEFNYSIQEMRDVSNSRAPHSLRFSMPMTDNNNQFFGQFYNVNFDSATFDAGVKTNVQVFDSGVPIMIGTLQLHKVTPFASKYEVSVLSEVASFFDSVKDLSFSEVFISDAGIDTDLDHALTGTNIVNSWNISNDITTGNVGAGVIVYPMSDWALYNGDNPEYRTGFFHYGNNSQNYGMGYGGSWVQNNLGAPCFKPAIRVNWLINRIAQKAGVTINSDFLTNDVSNLYMFLATETERAIGRPVYGSKVGLESDFMLQSSTTTVTTFLPLTAESPAPYNDVDGVFNSGVFVAPVTGSYQFIYNLVVTSNTSPLTGSYDLVVYVYKNYDPTSTDEPDQVHAQQVELTYGATHVIFDGYWCALNVDDTLTLVVKHSTNGNIVTFKPNVSEQYTYHQLNYYNTTGNFVDVSANFPDMTVGEFLTEIFNRFNLLLFTYPDSPTVINVEPYNDVLSATATKKDWTDRINENTISITPTTAYQKKRIIFEDGEGKDYKNQWWQDTNGYVKGRWIYENPNEFATSDERIGGKFTPMRLHSIPNYSTGQYSQVPNTLVPVFYDRPFANSSQKELETSKPVLAFYHGVKDIGNNREFLVGGEFMEGNGVQITQFPFFSPYSTSPVTTTTIGLEWSLNWGNELDHPLINAGNTPGVTNMHCFRKFWARRIHEEYSSASRIMTCEAFLTPLDIHTLQWNDEIFIDNSYWRVVKVSNFSTGQEKPAKLELLKLINASDWNKTEACSSYPATFNVDGTVNFVSLETGAAVSPTEACCTEYGFTWDNTDSVCFYSAGTDTGNSPNGGGSKPSLAEIKGMGLSIASPKILSPVGASPETKSLSMDDVIASKQKFNMTCKTTDNVSTGAHTASAETEFTLQSDTVYMLTVDVITVDTGGSAATIGNVMTMRYQGTVANTAGDCRAVGQTLINSEADAGASRTLTINQKQDALGRPSYFELVCVGETNKNITWLLDVELLQIAFSDKSSIEVGAVWNLANDPLITLNLATNQYLTWNI